MSNKNEEDLFHNQDTLLRRAWIESAIQGVRASLASCADAPEFGEPVGIDAPVAAEKNCVVRPGGIAAKRPALYVAWSAGSRRSGT